LCHDVYRTLAVKLQYTIENIDFIVPQGFLAMTMKLTCAKSHNIAIKVGETAEAILNGLF
jgi:hypothetical protein